MEELRANKQRAKMAMVLIWIMLLMDVLSFGSGYMQYDLLQMVDAGGFITPEEANANDSREQLVGIVSFLIAIISAITFILWFRRAYYNLHTKVEGLSFSEGWAAGSWFVPIVNLYRPYQIMQELYRDTINLLNDNGLSGEKPLNTKFLGVWWALWIISRITGQFLFRYSLRAESIDELTTSTMMSMILDMVGIPLALITIKVIKDYSSVEHLLEHVGNAASQGEANVSVGDDIDLIDG